MAAESNHYDLPFFKIIRARELDKYADFIIDELNPVQGWLVGDTAFYLLEYDFHHNISFDFEISDIWNSCKQFSLGGTLLYRLSPEDLLWFLCARVYHETMMIHLPTLRMFCDILTLLRSDNRSIDWQKILYVCKKYSLEPSLFYVLTHAKHYINDKIPKWFLDVINPENENVNNDHDWGDFFPKLFKKSYIVMPNI